MLQTAERSTSTTPATSACSRLGAMAGIDREWAPGQALGLSTDRLWVLSEGEVMVYRSGRPVDLWSAPHPLDLAGTVVGERSARFVAATKVRVRGVDVSAPGSSLTLEALAEETAALWGRVDTDARRDEDTFLPNVVPVPGPWWFRKVRGIAIVVQGDAARLQRSLPPGVHLLPGSGGRYSLVISRLEDAGSLDPRDSRRFLYHEVAPFLPVWSARTGPAVFVPEMYPDAWMAGVIGREIHGFPKRAGRIGFHDDGADLIVDQRLALRVRWRRLPECSPGAAMAGMSALLGTPRPLVRGMKWMVDRIHSSGRMGFPVLLRKRIPAPSTSGRTFEVDELVRVPFGLDPIVRAEPLDVRAAEIGSRASREGVLHGDVVGGYAIETGFRFGPGKVVRRYRRSE